MIDCIHFSLQADMRNITSSSADRDLADMWLDDPGPFLGYFSEFQPWHVLLFFLYTATPQDGIQRHPCDGWSRHGMIRKQEVTLLCHYQSLGATPI